MLRGISAVEGAGVSLRIQALFESREVQRLGLQYSQVRQRGHICEDALLEGGDIITMEGPEERRGCQCCVQRQGQRPAAGAGPALCAGKELPHVRFPSLGQCCGPLQRMPCWPQEKKEPFQAPADHSVPVLWEDPGFAVRTNSCT